MIKDLQLTVLIIFTVLAFTSWGCNENSTGPGHDDLTGESETYEILPAGDESVTGSLTLEERYDGFTRVTVELEDLMEDEEYYVHIYSNTALDGGDLLIELAALDNSANQSVIIVSVDEEGNTITYDDLISINAHLTVYLVGDEQDIIAAQADIGENALTGNSETVELNEVEESGISGTLELFERTNGHALAVIELTGTGSDQMYKAHLYENDNGDQNEPLFVFNDVDGETGLSMTNIFEIEDGTVFGYEEVTGENAAIHIYLDENDMTLIASGNLETDEESE